ncbi:universal stress protein [Actibacterium pelagium]|uniref:Universal stress protein n=1 Tax=Actibacterium pelagium TaxID=2029103 RepID=A0A917AG42_9RHOB|nr:universal stress protein [Actibacterium pelagium]GGE49945.1 universal stress protein [Actibacterium pelagium]
MYKHILVPIAPDHNPQTGEAMEIAQSLLADGGKITAITVIEPIPGYVATYIPEGMAEQQREDMVAQLKADLGGVKNADAHLVTGHPGTVIVDYSNEHGIDCIVIASHKPELQDFFLGSTAARVVRHARCAVHVIR